MIFKESYNGATIKGDAVMLSKYGDLYNVIDNAYHPNPGTREDGFSEIERCIDWIVRNNIHGVDAQIKDWLILRILNIDEEYNLETLSDDEIIEEIFYCDASLICNQLKSQVSQIVDDIKSIDFDDNPYIEYADKSEIDVAEQIADFINEKFLRIRAGGKLNPEGTDSLYFRISSHGFDWNRVITEFLWDYFKSEKNMPKQIVICHDAETNPPEIILFDGTPETLFRDFDTAKFESYKKKRNSVNISNNDRKSDALNKIFIKTVNKKKFI